jgi:hypothetical protein
MSLTRHQYNLVEGLLLPVATLKSSSLMPELAVMVSATVSARRRSGTASMATKTVLATTLLLTTTTSDRT